MTMMWAELEKCISRDSNKKIVLMLKLIDVKKISDKEGNNVFHYLAAVKKDKKEIVDYLISNGCNVNVKNHSGDTPLAKAVKNLNLDIVKQFLRVGADVAMVDGSGHTPLATAIKIFAANESRICCEIIRELINNGSDVDVKYDNGDSLLRFAFQKELFNVAELMIKANVDYILNVEDEYQRTPLHFAVLSRSLHLVKLLIELGSDVNKLDCYNNSCLYYTLKSTDFVSGRSKRMSLRSKASENVSGNCSILTYKLEDMLKLLIDAGADLNRLNSEGTTYLHQAIDLKYNLKVIKMLVESGADVNIKSLTGKTPLFTAVLRNNESLVKLLLEARADVNFKYVNNYTCLHVAVGRMYPKVMEMLLQYGANADVVDTDENPPACYWKSYCYNHEDKPLQCLKILSEYGVDIDCKNVPSEKRPIMIALRGTNSEAVLFLLEHGASFDFENESNKKFINSAAYIQTIFPLLKYTALHQALKKTDDLQNFDKDKLKSSIYRSYYGECEQELDIMKATQVYDSITLFDALNVQNIAKFARNQSIVDAIKEKNVLKKFRTYGTMLDRRLNEEVERQQLLESAKIGLGKILRLSRNSFPMIFNHILKFMKKKDLISLCSV